MYTRLLQRWGYNPSQGGRVSQGKCLKIFKLKQVQLVVFLYRYITVFKKEKSTIVAKDAVLELSDESRRIAQSLLSKSPVNAKDRVSNI